MLVSFVIRMSATALGAGRLAGEVEHVASGARGEFSDAADLAWWCAHVLDAETVPAPRASAADGAGVEPQPGPR